MVDPKTISRLSSNRAEIEAEQLSRLQTLLATVIPHNRFYRQKFAAEDIDGPVGSLREFIESVPFTTKQELLDDQARHPPYGTTLSYPLSQYTRFNLTSGTTGQPMRWLDTAESWEWMVSNKAKVFEAAAVTSEDRILFPFSFGPFLGFWLAFEAALRIGCLTFPGGGLNSLARLRMIIDNAITVLCCTPTYALRLGEIARAEKIDLQAARVRAIIVGGEPGGSLPVISRKIEQLWPRARVFDHHGMTEIGSVSYACPERPGILHVIESSYIAEIIDPLTGEPSGEETVGELVLTNLGRLGSPLLRYRTGDLVRRAGTGPCACGIHDLALAGGILGRLDDMVVIRGVNVWPSAIEEVVHTFQEVAEYRVVITTSRGMEEIGLQVELTSTCQGHEELVGRLQNALKAALRLRIPIEFVGAGTLPRFEMKAKRWVRT